MKNVWFALTVCFIFVLIYILNYLYPLFADDWTYSFIYGSDNVRVQSVADIIKSQHNHYHTWGGRSVAHTIAQFLLLVDFRLACFLNTAAYVALIYTIYRIVNWGNASNAILFFLLNAIVWFSQPAFYAAAIWKTGSGNYLWCALIAVLFLYRYYSYCRLPKKEGNLWKSVALFFLGVLAGWTNENIGVAVVFFVIISFIFIRYQKKPVPIWAIAGLAGLIGGCIMLLAAPGNYVRLDVTNTALAKRGIDSAEVLYLQARNVLKYFYHYLLILILVYGAILFLYIKNAKDKTIVKTVVICSFLFLSTGLAAHFVMVASPMFHLRSMFGIITFFIIAIGLVYTNIDLRSKYLKASNYLLVAIFCILFCIDYYKDYKDVNSISEFWSNREKETIEQARAGNDSIVFSRKFLLEHKYFIYELSTEDLWENEEYSRYYGIKSARAREN